MSLHKLGVVGALVMGFIVIPGAANAFSVTATEGEQLAHRMHQEGIRKEVDPIIRKDLKRVLQQAKKYADNLDLGCEHNRLYEVRLMERSHEWIAGYSAKVDCEDAPAPLSVYFDVNHRFLSVFEHGM